MSSTSSIDSGAKPLDLIIGHLTDCPIAHCSPGTDSLSGFDSLIPDFDTPFVPATRVFSESPGWFRPSVGFSNKPDYHFVVKVQEFASGGYEATFVQQELKKIGFLAELERNHGKRVKCEQNPNDILTSIQRSKRKIRHLIKSMGCDRLLTLTKRENNPDTYWTPEDWASAWDKLNRLCKKYGVKLAYVAVLEKHKKGNYHMHAAIVGRINVKHLRKMWLCCCGKVRGSGNIDIKYKTNCTAHKRRAGLAKYVSKYISKQIEQVEFNKKRYWSSRHKLPDIRRYILNSPDIGEALREFAGFFGLNIAELMATAFMFGEGAGAWFSFDDHLAIPPPF